jgi:hypothetical protein
MAVFWDVATCSLADIALMKVAVSSSGTSVNTYRTAQYNITEDSHLLSRHRENLKFTEVLRACMLTC